MKMTAKQEEEQRRRRAVLALYEMQALALKMAGGNAAAAITPAVSGFYQQESNADVYLTEGSDKYLKE